MLAAMILLVRELVEATDLFKFEMRLQWLIGSFEDAWSSPNLQCINHIISYAPYVVICE